MTIPITIIAGYLGAGKTTHINKMLQDPKGERLAILVNDFGDINIDAALIEAQSADTIALTNGCVCCSVADSLAETLERLSSDMNPPDRIVIEASGVAQPDKVAKVGDGWSGLVHDRSITLVDMSAIERQLKDKYIGRLVRDQIATADEILLTKEDLTPPVARDRIRDHITTLLGASAPDRKTDPELCTPKAHKHVFWSFSVHPKQPVKEKFLSEMETLLPLCQRAKGFIRFEGSNEFSLLNWSGGRLEIRPHSNAPPEQSSLIFIGTGPIDRKYWQHRLSL